MVHAFFDRICVVIKKNDRICMVAKKNDQICMAAPFQKTESVRRCKNFDRICVVPGRLVNPALLVGTNLVGTDPVDGVGGTHLAAHSWLLAAAGTQRQTTQHSC